MTTEPTAPGPAVCKFEQGCHRVVPCEPGCGAPAVPVPPPTAAVWVDGDPLMEAIAATVWERCARDDADMPQLVLDDPRTIAAAAAPVARAIMLRQAAEEAQSCVALFEGDEDEEGSAAAGAVEGLADRFRRMAAEAPTTTKPPCPDPIECSHEAALGQAREIGRRLAAHAVGFQDVLDDSDRGPWAKTVGADIAALQAALSPAPPSAGVRQDGAQPSEVTVYLSTRCDACEHTLNWHRNDVGCMVTRCVCGRFQPPAEDGVQP